MESDVWYPRLTAAASGLRGMMIYDHPVGAALDEHHGEPRRVRHRLAVAHAGELVEAGADNRHVAQHRHVPFADLDLPAAAPHRGVILADGGGPLVDGRTSASTSLLLNAAAQRSISALASSAGPARA